ncbi:MAG: HU family DNA-binding protein [Elusimicrobia bacterium]|nr:HU family DNA-binding protein [Elusimicrobiota bacterium]
MKKQDFIKELTSVLGQRRDAEIAVTKFLKTIRDSLKKGEKVVLTGIGSLYPKLRKAQKRHNPKTMQPVEVPPKRTVRFVASEELFH